MTNVLCMRDGRWQSLPKYDERNINKQRSLPNVFKVTVKVIVRIYNINMNAMHQSTAKPSWNAAIAEISLYEILLI